MFFNLGQYDVFLVPVIFLFIFLIKISKFLFIFCLSFKVFLCLQFCFLDFQSYILLLFQFLLLLHMLFVFDFGFEGQSVFFLLFEVGLTLSSLFFFSAFVGLKGESVVLFFLLTLLMVEFFQLFLVHFNKFIPLHYNFFLLLFNSLLQLSLFLQSLRCLILFLNFHLVLLFPLHINIALQLSEISLLFHIIFHFFLLLSFVSGLILQLDQSGPLILNPLTILGNGSRGVLDRMVNTWIFDDSFRTQILLVTARCLHQMGR